MAIIADIADGCRYLGRLANEHRLVAAIVAVVGIAVIAYFVIACAALFGSGTFDAVNNFIHKNAQVIVCTAVPLLGPILAMLYKRYVLN